MLHDSKAQGHITYGLWSYRSPPAKLHVPVNMIYYVGQNLFSFLWGDNLAQGYLR